jgi:hypothetical protein
MTGLQKNDVISTASHRLRIWGQESESLRAAHDRCIYNGTKPTNLTADRIDGGGWVASRGSLRAKAAGVYKGRPALIDAAQGLGHRYAPTSLNNLAILLQGQVSTRGATVVGPIPRCGIQSKNISYFKCLVV